ncbi:MAG: metal ion ABC transporter periplasmic protein, zinc transport system substrate-binding protein [Candidatus Peregrinibacteria bacterium GW2011_GWE2_39_6]|nr:MAG: metal ion ABC transporter periplasmic protein, zinc transport system substrate-binding protein [Candidatus Peregrinibacteria bacterium GW2011_GWF2_39_17]KKR24187.1 MAG: metal ion ABC transporter periplasmic protein, zinc transport system substrate-binding protein [Candidatus Peregrinibacteria bacterium GW2011_GWE2_39_6]HCW32101.1 zinc-binding protein [Candidatus Peregrinibacteria bacterium]
MKKALFALAVVSLIVVGILRASPVSRSPESDFQKIKITTTLFSLYDFAKNIGQDKVEILLLLPPGIEAHSFEPTPSNIVTINESDLFIYSGKFMEPWVDDLIAGMKEGSALILNASRGVELMVKKEHDQTDVDPHFWLNFDNAKIVVDHIAQALSEVDPYNASFYQKNAQGYKEQLGQLDFEYQDTLLSCQSKKIIYGGHYALGYLAKRYGLIYTAAQGLAPDAEPTVNDLIALVTQINENDFKYIFYEELASPKIAETLAKETGAKMLLLHSAHNLSKKDYENNATFLSLMRNNLANLSVGLNCSN